MPSLEKIEELNPDILPWEQQPGEPDCSFQRFQKFLDLGPNRTLARLAHRELEERKKNESEDAYLQQKLIENLKGEKRHKTSSAKPTSVISLVTQYSAAFLWMKRAAAWDNVQYHEEQAQRREAVKDMAKRHSQAAKKMLDTALQKLQKRLVELPDENWSVEDVRKWLLDAQKLERLAWGEAETITENQSSMNVEKMSAQQRKDLFEKIAEKNNVQGPPDHLDNLTGGKPIITRDEESEYA